MKQMVPEYLLNFIEEVYPYEKPKFFGQCLIAPATLNKLKTLYSLYSSDKPVNYGERMCPNYIAKMLEEKIFTELTIEDTGYTLETPSKALKTAQLNIVGGKSYKSENLAYIKDKSQTHSNIAYVASATEQTLTLNGTSNAVSYQNFEMNIIPSGTYYVSVLLSGTASTSCNLYLMDENNIGTAIGRTDAPLTNQQVTFTTNQNYLRINVASADIVFTNLTIKIMVSKTSITEYKKGFDGIRDSAITSIVADSTLVIPDEVQALNGYGQSNPDDSTEYNYIDFNQNKFIQIGYIDENYEWQELETPVKTDISQYIDSNFIDVVPNGTITFNNEYDQAVPYSIDFVVEV